MTGGIKGLIKKIKIPDLSARLKALMPESGKPVVAVEIGNDWLKIARQSCVKKNRCIDQVSLTRLAEIKDSVTSAVANIFRDLKLSRQSVITYIPRHLVTIRILDLPATDPKEIADMVGLQAAKQTPYSKEEIIYSHKIIDADPAGYTKVMLAIAARNIINERMNTLQNAGLSVTKVAVSSEGVYSWFKNAYMRDIKLYDHQGVAVVDIDSNYSDFIVIRRGKMAFTRNIFIGANHLMDEPLAWRDKFVEELKRSLERYQSEEKNIKITKIFLCGAGRNIEGMDADLSAKLEIPTENTEQLKNIPVSFNAEILKEGSRRHVSITQLIGAVMNQKDLHIDLSSGEHKIQKLMDDKRKQLTVMGVLFIAIVTMFSLLLLINIYNKNAYLEMLKQKLSKVGAEASGVEKMRTVINLVEKRLDSRGSSIDVINEIYRITPPEIYIIDISIDEKQDVTIKGGAAAMSDVFKYVKILEGSAILENVKTAYTTTKKEKDAEFAEFEITCSYEK
jgi:Tfp pilus assembly PilM family ATPase/Tfp pilus assembly protein PilN